MEQLQDYRRERHGLREPPPLSIRPIRITGKDAPLTEEDKEFNRAADAAVKTLKDLDRSSSRLSRLLDQKIFVAESLSFLTSKITGSAPQIFQGLCPQDLDYDENSRTLNAGEEHGSITVTENDVNSSPAVDVALSCLIPCQHAFRDS